MSCLSDKRREKLRKADIFQTPRKLEASWLGAVNGFFVLPTAILVYAVVLASSFNTIHSNSTIEITKACTPLNFTCTSIYGCEIAPLGALTTEKFSKVEGVNILEKGETATEMVCPGYNEALDMAPRASFRIPGEMLPRSLAHNGFGYFMRQPGVVYKVNLTIMSVVLEKKLVDDRLIDAFQVEKYGYFVTQKLGLNLTVLKMDLETMEIVGTGTIVEKAPRGTRQVETPAHEHYAYFLLLGPRIAKFNLNTMKVEKERSFSQILYFDWGIISGYKDYHSTPPQEVRHLYVKDGGMSKQMYVLDMESLEVKNVTDIGNNIKSVCSSDGYAVGEIRIGTAYGKTKSIDPKTLSVGVPLTLKYDQDLKFPITALLCDPGLDDGIAGISPKHSSPMAFSYGAVSHGKKINLYGAKELHAPINTPEAVYFVSTNTDIISTNTDDDRDGHVLKLDRSQEKSIHKQLIALLSIPNDGEPIGYLQSSRSMKFPAEGSKHSITSLFRTTTFGANGSTGLEYAFWPEYVRNFDEEDCKTYQPNYLCRRVNLAPTELKIVKSLKYSMYVILTLCLTASSTIYNGLKMFTRHGPKIYGCVKNKCCNREARGSNLSSRLLQVETVDSARMDLLPDVVDSRNRNGQ